MRRNLWSEEEGRKEGRVGGRKERGNKTNLTDIYATEARIPMTFFLSFQRINIQANYIKKKKKVHFQTIYNCSVR